MKVSLVSILWITLNASKNLALIETACLSSMSTNSPQYSFQFLISMQMSMRCNEGSKYQLYNLREMSLRMSLRLSKQKSPTGPRSASRIVRANSIKQSREQLVIKNLCSSGNALNASESFTAIDLSSSATRRKIRRSRSTKVSCLSVLQQTKTQSRFGTRSRSAGVYLKSIGIFV